MESAHQTQDRYENFYNAIQSELNNKKICESLLQVCSVYLDRNGNNNIVHVEFLLEPTTIKEKGQIKKCFDKYAPVFGFSINYQNLSGDISNF